MIDLTITLIEEEEGVSSHAYLCRGLWHIGMGCLVDPSVPSDGLCQAAIDAQAQHDREHATVLAARLPSYFQCNEVRQAVLISMCFQLGSLSDWPDFRAALAKENFAAAAAAGRASKWWGQTTKRAEREMKMLETGVWVEHSE